MGSSDPSGDEVTVRETCCDKHGRIGIFEATRHHCGPIRCNNIREGRRELFLFVLEGCYQVFLLKKRFFKFDLVYKSVLLSGVSDNTCQPSLQIDICGSDVSTTANIRDLGVYLDSTMSMTTHVTRVCGTAYGRLRNIARIRSSLPLLACKTLVHALVTSTLDFGNAALFGITGTLLHRLEMVQRAAARVVLCIDRRDHRSMTAALRDLHWLPIALRIEFKVLTLMHGAVHNSTPLKGVDPNTKVGGTA